MLSASSNFLSTLNDRQREAVLTTDGPLIVLAGAGSGKTKMLTSRIAYLIEGLGIAPYRILAMTFTNKAATEMKERVAKHLAGTSILGEPEIGTFHSVCVRLLRREADRTPFTKPFVIYDDSDQLSLIKGITRRLGLDEKSFNPKAFQAAINRAKCDATEPHEMQPAPHNIFEKQLQRVFELYQNELFSNNALDFGEIICMTYRLLRDHPDLREKYQRRFEYIHVDEYQDTNRSQYLLLSTLAGSKSGGHKNLCVVGDEDQSIYKWRGADIRNILDFENDFPGARIVKLEQNYRSTKTIITAAGQVIRNNTTRKDKTLWTENPQGRQIIRTQLPDERAEAEMVVSEIKKNAADQGRPYDDFAIFYRTNAQSRQFEDVLRREKIPYRIYGGLRFYDRKEIKDALSYFKVVLNPEDSVSLKRIINIPGRGIGKTTIDKVDELQVRLQETGDPKATFWSALRVAASDPTVTSAGTMKKLAAFVALIEKLTVEQSKVLLSDLYHLILDETGYVRELRLEGTEEASARVENLEEFDTILQEFEEDQKGIEKKDLLPLFLEQSALASEADQDQGEGSTVSMMTLHSSKGLEFPVVFLVGMEEGLFPSLRAWEEETQEDVEEERRLCYVGMTRARELLYLFNVMVRRIWGNVSYQEPARFFAEMPDELVEFRDLSYGSATGMYRTGSSRQFGGQEYRQTEMRQPTPVPVRAAEASLIGQRLDHPSYGPGTIIGSEGTGEDQKVTVEFRGRERKKFLLRYLKSCLE